MGSRSKLKAFPSGEGGTAAAVTEEGRYKVTTVPMGPPLPASLCSATLPKGEGVILAGKAVL